MRFYGQQRIRREVSILINRIREGSRMNIALIAPSGYGKTTLGQLILGELGPHQSSVAGPPDFIFDDTKLYHLLDEIHLLTYPEVLYEIMDSREYVIIIATNEPGSLKEPLLNRCIQLQFAPYENSELLSIANDMIGNDIDSGLHQMIVNAAKGNPRELKSLCERLLYVSKEVVISSEEMLNGILEDVLNIYGGLTTLERRYLEALENLGGVASIKLLSNATGLSRITLERMEPGLIEIGKIKITKQGRFLNGQY